MCDEGDNQPEVVPCVSFPDDNEVAHSWKCTGCLKPFDIEKLLNPKVCIENILKPIGYFCHYYTLQYVPKEKVPSTSTVCETVSEGAVN